MNYLNDLLNFDEETSQDAQDWDLELADSKRVKEFLDAYETAARNDDDRFAMMALIIASYNDLLHYGGNTEIWERIRIYLLRDFQLHIYTISYWCHNRERNPKYRFKIAALMRDVFREGTVAR